MTVLHFISVPRSGEMDELAQVSLGFRQPRKVGTMHEYQSTESADLHERCRKKGSDNDKLRFERTSCQGDPDETTNLEIGPNMFRDRPLDSKPKTVSNWGVGNKGIRRPEENMDMRVAKDDTGSRNRLEFYLR